MRVAGNDLEEVIESAQLEGDASLLDAGAREYVGPLLQGVLRQCQPNTDEPSSPAGSLFDASMSEGESEDLEVGAVELQASVHGPKYLDAAALSAAQFDQDTVPPAAS